MNLALRAPEITRPKCAMAATPRGHDWRLWEEDMRQSWEVNHRRLRERPQLSTMTGPGHGGGFPCPRGVKTGGTDFMEDGGSDTT